MSKIRSRTFLLIVLLYLICNVSTQQTAEGTSVVDVEDEVLDLDEVEAVPSHNLDKEVTSKNVTANLTVEEKMGEAEKGIKVKNHLESLSDAELEKLCKDRGFAVAVDGGGELTHEDYVEAAQRCLSLEDEMNAILAENPELAAELETEIERMKLEKERLGQERDGMVAEMATLEEKLRLSGVDPSSLAGSKALDQSMAASQSVDEVLRESFVMLFDRVGRDFRLIGRIARVALRPAFGGLQLVWRYTGSTVEGLIKQGITFAESAPGAEQISVARRVVSIQWNTASNLLRKLAAPALKRARVIALRAIQALNQREEIRKCGLIINAILGPLRDSLLSGWRSVKPDLTNAMTKTSVWMHRLRDERKTKDPARQIKKEMRKSK